MSRATLPRLLGTLRHGSTIVDAGGFWVALHADQKPLAIDVGTGLRPLTYAEATQLHDVSVGIPTVGSSE